MGQYHKLVKQSLKSNRFVFENFELNNIFYNFVLLIKCELFNYLFFNLNEPQIKN